MEQVSRRKLLLVEYALMTFVLLWSGGAATYGLFDKWPYVMAVLTTLILFHRHQKIKRRTLVLIGVFVFVLLLQTLYFHGGISSMAKPVLGFYSLAAIAVIIGPDFGRVFVKIMALFAFISLAFWLMDITPYGHETLLMEAKKLPQFGGAILAEHEGSTWEVYRQQTLYLYSVSDAPVSEFYSMARNTGPFFEQGRYSVFLTAAMAVILLSGKYRKNRLAFYLIMLANITTFSTTGYLAMIILFAVYFFFRNNRIKFSDVILILALIVGIYYVMRMPFMGEKIFSAMEDTDVVNSRFGAMYYHWTQIVDSPFIGYGIYLTQQVGESEISPCGITDMLRIWGIPIFVFSIWLLYKGSRSYLPDNRLSRVSFVILLLILAYTQTVMTAPFYFLLYFMETEGAGFGLSVSSLLYSKPKWHRSLR